MAHSLDAVPVAKLESFLVCSICLETLNDPRTLPCFHSYCRSCLEKFVKKQRDRARFGQQIREFNCPTCRNQFTLNPEDKVEDMGQSHFICNMLEVMAVDQHRVKGVPCTHCQRPSVGRCVTCEVFLCQECLKSHNSYLGFKDHVVLSMDELSKPENQKKVRGKLHCKEHDKKTLKFYCETCQELVCRYCMDFNHEKPDHSCSPAEKVARKEKQILVSNSAALENKLMECKNALRKVINAKQSLEKVKEQTKQNINQRKDNLLKEVTQQLNDQAQYLLKQVDEIYVAKHNTLVQQEDQVKGYVERLESCVSLSKGLLQKGTDEEILASTKMMKNNFKTLSNETCQKVESVDENIICYQWNPIVSKFSEISEQMGRVTAGTREKFKPLYWTTIPVRERDTCLSPKSQHNRMAEKIRAILVSDLPEGVTENNLTIHFQKKKNGGGEVEKVKLLPGGQAAEVVFENPAVVQEVMNKQQIIKGKAVKIKLSPDSGNQVHKLEKGIHVSDLPEDVTENTLIIHFQKKKNGGGEVQKVTLLPGGEAAEVIFEDPEVVQEVMKKQQIIKGKVVKMDLATESGNWSRFTTSFRPWVSCDVVEKLEIPLQDRFRR